jgi:hypothetical protein
VDGQGVYEYSAESRAIKVKNGKGSERKRSKPEVASCHFPRETEENHKKKPLLRRVGVLAEIRTGYLPNRIQKRYVSANTFPYGRCAHATQNTRILEYTRGECENVRANFGDELHIPRGTQ